MDFFPVDIYVQIFLFGRNFDTRHLSKNTNIAFWITIHPDYINEQNKHILEKYRPYLNQKHALTLVKCLEIQMPLIPILCNQPIKNIERILNAAICHANVEYINKINNEYELCNVMDYQHLLWLIVSHCKSGNFIDVIKWFYEVFGLKDIDDYNKYTLLISTYHLNDFETFHYIYNTFEYTKGNILTGDSIRDSIINFIVKDNNFDFFQKICKNIGLTKRDIYPYYKSICLTIFNLDRVEFIEYFYKSLKFTNIEIMHDIDGNNILQEAFKCDAINSIKYLYKNFIWSKNAFRLLYPDNILLPFCKSNSIKFLHKEIGFTKREFKAYVDALKKKSIVIDGNVIQYLCRNFGFTKQDFYEQIVYYKNNGLDERTKSFLRQLIRSI